MTGCRLGYAVAPEPWMTGLKKATLYSSNGVSTPTQWGGLAAFEIDASSQEKITAEYRLRRDLLLSGLNELGFTCDPPAGAFYAFPDASRISRDSREAADILLNQAKVATVPGIVFGPDGQSHLRFSFSTSIETIEAGLDSLRRQPLMKDEFEFIETLRQRASASSSVIGIGDDAAVFQTTAGKETVVTTDLLIEDVDFRRTTIPPYLLGHKALAVSLSDIAAMGARPRWSLTSIGVPE